MTKFTRMYRITLINRYSSIKTNDRRYIFIVCLGLKLKQGELEEKFENSHMLSDLETESLHFSVLPT